METKNPRVRASELKKGDVVSDPTGEYTRGIALNDGDVVVAVRGYDVTVVDLAIGVSRYVDRAAIVPVLRAADHPSFG